MKAPVQIHLLPSGKTWTVPRGSPLKDILFAEGVEFPCGGHGQCKGCRIRVLSGTLPVREEECRLLTDEERDAGWRLACTAHAESDLTFELAEWEAPILTDGSTLTFTPQEGLGVAVDLGTTTLVAQLLDLKSGRMLAVCSASNNQAVHGTDIMSRVTHAAQGGLKNLADIIRLQIGEMIDRLLRESGASPTALKRVILVGNTVMHHIFSHLDVSPLAHHPFEPDDLGMQTFTADELRWDFGTADLQVMFLPCLGGFVGSDILAGILATRLHESESTAALIDLGTNGEMVVGNRERLLCASTAAGPAFEGARIAMGMRAMTGAIAEVTLQDGHPQCRVLGGTSPRGLCGSGLVDAVAVGLELGEILPNGRLAAGTDFMLSPPVHLTQCDVRELQLAKGAIASGLRILTGRCGLTLDQLSAVHLAGAFGNYMNLTSAARIGLLSLRPEQVMATGNTALRGAKLTLFNAADVEKTCAQIKSITQHISLNEDQQFQDVYIEEMHFPKCLRKS